MSWHSDLGKRKPTGGKKRFYRGRRKFERGGYPAETAVGEEYRVMRRVRGGNIKPLLYASERVQVSDERSGKTQTVKVLKVVSNPANIDYNRRRIITKGAMVETEIGMARITSRPGQDGLLNASLVEAAGKK